MNSGRILVAGPRTLDVRQWAKSLSLAGFSVKQCDAREPLSGKSAEGCDGVLFGLYEATAALWLNWAKQLRSRFPSLKITALAVESSEDLAVQALRARVDDYIREVNGEVVVSAAKRMFGTSEVCKPAAILGESEAVRRLRERLERLAKADCNVLITGESGTGKELAATAIHSGSARSNGRLICINCAAIPESLVESELFGRERGAFTGADAAQDGKLKAADGGVIFLDEIGDLSLYAQAKILRAVETKEVYRLGSNKPITVNVRILAATHRNLEDMVRQGVFRQDLFFRLNVGQVRIPPLRERIEDLHILVHHYLRTLNEQMGTRVTQLSEETWDCLARHPWPGNVRELKNVIESLLVNSSSTEVSVDDLPEQFQTPPADTRQGEREHLVKALLAANWNKSKAAEKLNWSRMKLYRKMSKYSVSAATGSL